MFLGGPIRPQIHQSVAFASISQFFEQFHVTTHSHQQLMTGIQYCFPQGGRAANQTVLPHPGKNPPATNR